MSETDHIYPGVDRWQYFVGKISMIFAIILVAMLFGPGSPLMKFAGLAMMFGTLVLDVMRLRNIGVSQWYAFIRFLPFGNTVLDICLQSAQTGWAETRKLDDTGKRILMTELIFLAIMLFLAWRARMLMPLPLWT
jgi:uncharacterized membrane protein YhaH (DUF805 family)